MRMFKKLILISILGSCCNALWAARPMITDDARIVDEGSCQVESWAKFNQNINEYWALPSCNIGGNFELTLGGAKSHGDTIDGGHWGLVQVQGKTLLRAPKTNDWSVGLAVGHVKNEANLISPRMNDHYFYIPWTQSLRNDGFFIHVNVGASQKNDEKKYIPTAGLGMEYQIAPNSYLIAEGFQDSSEKLAFQGGVRHWLIPQRAQIDMTIGNKGEWDRNNRWISIGIRLLSPKWH